MDDEGRRLGQRLQAERQKRDWSLTDLAERAGVSRAMIHKIERGESSPTAALLGKLSAAFGLTLSALLVDDQSGPAGEATGHRLARQSEQPSWSDPATGFTRRLLTPPGAASLFELISCTLPPGASIGYPAGAYGFIDQQITVTDGVLTFEQGSNRYRLTPGDCLHLGPPAPCRYQNDGDQPCRYLVVIARR